MKIIGLMSGTSADGLDVALIEVNSLKGYNLLDYISVDYDENIRKKILKACDIKTSNSELICQLNRELGDIFFEGVKKIIEKNDLSYEDVSIVSSHGQTVWHDVKSNKKSTLQIGSGEIIAEKTGITVINNFRMRDIAANGEGAPLVPYTDYLLFSGDKNIILQNIGGIGNFTYLKKDGKIEDVVASDTGPGNMIIDYVINILSNGKNNYDKNGEWAKKGKTDQKFLNELMNHPIIKKHIPKTSGREDFGEFFSEKMLQKMLKEKLDKYDIIKTLTEFTALSIIDCYEKNLGDIDEIYISGGGSYNSEMIRLIEKHAKSRLGDKVVVKTMEEIGLSSDSKEAISFALLGYSLVKGISNNVPSATGALNKVLMGNIIPGKNFIFPFIR